MKKKSAVKNVKPEEKEGHGKSQAVAQVESIVEMVDALEEAGDDDDKRERLSRKTPSPLKSGPAGPRRGPTWNRKSL